MLLSLGRASREERSSRRGGWMLLGLGRASREERGWLHGWGVGRLPGSGLGTTGPRGTNLGGGLGGATLWEGRELES